MRSLVSVAVDTPKFGATLDMTVSFDGMPLPLSTSAPSRRLEAPVDERMSMRSA